MVLFSFSQSFRWCSYIFLNLGVKYNCSVPQLGSKTAIRCVALNIGLMLVYFSWFCLVLSFLHCDEFRDFIFNHSTQTIGCNMCVWKSLNIWSLWLYRYLYSFYCVVQEEILWILCLEKGVGEELFLSLILIQLVVHLFCFVLMMYIEDEIVVSC